MWMAVFQYLRTLTFELSFQMSKNIILILIIPLPFKIIYSLLWVPFTHGYISMTPVLQHRLPRWCIGKEFTCLCPSGGSGNPLQYSCWGKFTDRGTWQATVHRTAKSQIWWKQLSICTHGLTANLLEYKSRFMLFQLYSILRICYLQDLVSYFSYVTYFTGSLPGSKALKRQASVQLLLGNQDIRVAESGRT